MNVTCPSCGADMDLNVLLAHDDSRRALARLVEISMPFGRLVLQYLRLFKPRTRALGHGRTVKLLEQLLPDVERGAIEHKGRLWPAPRETWLAALERVIGQRDEVKLVLPLTSHGYLYAVIAGMADRAESQAEAATESGRRTRSRSDVQPIAAFSALPPGGRSAPAPAPDYSRPSRAALRIQAENAARRAARDAGAPAADTDASQ